MAEPHDGQCLISRHMESAMMAEVPPEEERVVRTRAHASSLFFSDNACGSVLHNKEI